MTDDELLNDEVRRVKTFMRSMNLFDLSSKERQNFLKDKRLTQAEKTILEMGLALKDCDYKTVIQNLIELKTNNELVESQRCLVLAMAYNYSGHCEKAIDLFHESIKALEKHKLARYEINVQLQLFFTYLNLKNKNELGKILDRMEEIVTPSTNIKEKISFMRCRFNYFMIMEQFVKAGAQLKELEKRKDDMHQSQWVFHLVDKFIYFLKIDNYKACEMTLEEMKSSRKYAPSVNYRFMKSMLAHVMYQTPIYLYDTDFQDVPILYFQLKVIQSLESGNFQEAEKFWLKLHKLNPDVYSQFMNYKGDKCLFSLCLNIYVNKPAMNEVLPALEGALQPREKKLIEILSQKSVPVRKEDLYELIWGQALSGKDELFKLSMLVTRLRKKSGLNIKSQKGCYTLIQETRKKIS